MSDKTVIPMPTSVQFSPTYEFALDRIWRIKDGDTIVAEVLTPFGRSERKCEIRFLDIDTWESRRRKGRTEEHVKLGKAATDFLVELLKGEQPGPCPACLGVGGTHCCGVTPWKRVWVRCYKVGKHQGNFGRFLFEMYLDSKDGNTYSVAEYLKANGFEKQKGV